MSGDIEILITGRGDKTVRPRSFTPAAVPSLSSTPAPVPIFSLGKVEVGQQLHVLPLVALQDGVPVGLDGVRVGEGGLRAAPESRLELPRPSP